MSVQKRLEKAGIRSLRDLALRDRKAVMKSCRISRNEDIEMERAINIFSYIVWDRARDRSWQIMDLMGPAANKIDERSLQSRIEEVIPDLPGRVRGCLKRAGCRTLSDVLRKSIPELDQTPRFGFVTRDALAWRLASWIADHSS